MKVAKQQLKKVAKEDKNRGYKVFERKINFFLMYKMLVNELKYFEKYKSYQKKKNKKNKTQLHPSPERAEHFEIKMGKLAQNMQKQSAKNEQKN